LQSASSQSDAAMLAALALDSEREVAAAAVEVLTMLGEQGLRELRRSWQCLPADAAAERRQLLAAAENARRRAPTASTDGDPFESPRGTSPNCGPDDRLRFDVRLENSQDFAEFLRTRGQWLGEFVKLDDFRGPSGEVDWAKVASSSCAGFELRMTSDGYTSLYGCCGV
jgi:hypothetical protein